MLDDVDIKNSDIKEIVKRELGFDPPQRVDEAFVAQPKPFDVKTEKLSQQTLQGHMELYKGYVEKFNEISAKLDTASTSDAGTVGTEYRALKRAETYALNAIYLHELYFANVGDQNSMLYADSIAHMRLDRDFGNFKHWQDDFIACAMSAREGWVVCCLNTFLKRYVNVIIDGDDVGIPLGCMPLVVIDMWSHSYYKDYTTDKRKYVRQVMSELNWKVIEERFLRAERILDALK